jgi:hypothetical protein
MSPLKNSLLTALASAAFTAGCLYAIHHRRAEEAAHLRYANNRMLRLEADQVRQNQSSIARPAAAETAGAARPAQTGTATPNPTHAGGYRNEGETTPISTTAGDYLNEGQATPLATLQTIAWACDRGDNQTVAKLLCFDTAGRAKAAAYMATLPANARAPWNSLDEMAAAVFTAETMEHPFPNAMILDTATPDQISEDRVMLRLPDTPKDRTVYQKTDAGWKFVITGRMVDNYVARAAAPRD